ncbi:mitochondrial ribosomal subunit protein-domain-containing protein [Xylaria palmicola]|nr:mitochondrial ribosomal subunit protein-domain-containing protein [Xylaria palmicola]
MASAVRPLRLCLRAASRRAATPASVAPRMRLVVRPFSSTPFPRRPAAKKDDVDELEDELEDGGMDEAELERILTQMQTDKELVQAQQIQERLVHDLNTTVSGAMRMKKANRKTVFWSDDEPDTELLSSESDPETFDEDEIMPLGHAKFEEFREYREYARIAAWQMPLLSKLATPFEAPTAQEPLRFRFTSYMGEFHPAENKVVVEFCPRDLPLNEAQQQKLRKLLGPRWNPETDIAKMSCEQFEHPAQNKRYLGDVVNELVAQAKDPTDMFEDIPLDTRHHTFKTKPKFPKEWRMTEERRKFIEDTREKALLLDQTKAEQGTLVDGTERINSFFKLSAPKAKIPEMANMRLRGSLSGAPLRR